MLMIAVTVFVSVAATLALSMVVSWLFDLFLWSVFFVVIAAALVAFGIFTYRVRIKVIRDYPKPGKHRWHWSAWRFQHYDRFLDKRVQYARHAQAIDETRRDFARVGWGRKEDQENAQDDWLVQKWFAGNHSDIGGSYPETESRLSDIALQWMAKEAEQRGMIIDWDKLHLFPGPAGPQHCEITSVRELYPTWMPSSWRLSWSEEIRSGATLSTCHESVLVRLELSKVSKCGIDQEYRPEALRNIPEFAKYYP
jgi:hypothetical protein